MRKALNWIRKKYNAVPVYITETGISDHDGKLHDEKRISYFKKYTDEVLKGNSFLTKNILYHSILIGCFIYLCFTPTLAAFQLFRGVGTNVILTYTPPQHIHQKKSYINEYNI